MKKILYLIQFVICLGFLMSCKPSKDSQENDKVVLAYVTSWSDVMPDPTYLTHINYAFGHVDSTFDRIRIDNEERLKSIVALKQQKPSLKVILSVGGWGSGNFSEMAASDSLRGRFADDCVRVMQEFGLDGVDIDWEYPTDTRAGISHSDDDTENFTKLMRDMRKAMGDEAIVSFATPTPGKFYDYKAVEPYISFLNLMGYDIAMPPYHHAGLYRSEHTSEISVSESVDLHISLGIPAEKIVLGLPFYGHVKEGYQFGGSRYHNIERYEGELTFEWDDVAKAPYLASGDGELIVSYEDTVSIGYKAQYIRDKGLMGAMYWEYSGDNENKDLQRKLYNGVRKD